MAKEELAAILNDMAPDDRTALFDELPAKVTQQMLALLSPPERAIAVSLLGYPEGSIGRLMTPDYVRVRPEWTVELVIEHIRRHGRDSETLSLIYVIDDNGVLIDDLRIRRVLLAPPQTKIRELLDHRFVALKATDDQETAIEVFRNQDRYALPVTDSGGVLIGILTIDDVLDIAQEEATEDIHKIGGMEALDEPYMETPLRRMIKKRATWLAALFLGEMLTATAMGYFEQEIQRAVVLALFVPLIISSGGQFRFSGLDARYPRTGAGRNHASGLVACHSSGILFRAGSGSDSRFNRLPANHPVGDLHESATVNTGSWWL